MKANQIVTKKYKDYDLEYAVLDISKFLPSGGKFYRSKEVFVRGFRFAEQMSVSKLYESPKDANTIKQVLCLYEEAILLPDTPIDEIIYEDFINLMLWVGLMTNESSAINVQYVCGGCEKTNSEEIVLAESEEIAYEDFTEKEMKIIDTSIGKVTIGPLRVKDIIDILEYNDDLGVMRYAGFIRKINGEEVSIEKRVEFYGMLTHDEGMKIIDIAEGFKSRLKPIVRKCSKCGDTNEVYINLDFIKGLP